MQAVHQGPRRCAFCETDKIAHEHATENHEDSENSYFDKKSAPIHLDHARVQRKLQHFRELNKERFSDHGGMPMPSQHGSANSCYWSHQTDGTQATSSAIKSDCDAFPLSIIGAEQWTT